MNGNAADAWNGYHVALGPSLVGANPTIPRRRTSTAPGGSDSGRRGDVAGLVAGGVDRSGSKASRASRRPVSREFSGSMRSRVGAERSFVVDARVEQTRTRAMPLSMRYGDEQPELEDEVLDVRPVYAI